MQLNFSNKSKIDLDTLRKIWELSAVLKQNYLSPPEFIIYCKYISMYQWGIPLSYENLMIYNSQLPFPIFYYEEPVPQHFVTETNEISFQQHENYLNEPQKSQDWGYSHTTSRPVDEDLSSLINPSHENFNQPEINQTVSDYPLEQNQNISQAEERLKRFDLLSSVFDEALMEDANSKFNIIESKIYKHKYANPQTSRIDSSYNLQNQGIGNFLF